MPPRRAQQFTSELRLGAHLRARWETERDLVRYAVVLVAAVGEAWHPVVLFDCSHDDRNDRHDYSFSGIKRQAVIFHYGTPAEGMRAANSLDSLRPPEDDRTMATVETAGPSAAQLATWRVMDVEMDTVIVGGEGRFPSQMAFVPSDLATDEVIRRHHAEGSAVVIVDENGNERFLPVP